MEYYRRNQHLFEFSLQSLTMQFKVNKKGENFAVCKFGRSKELVVKKYEGYYYIHLQKQGYPSKSNFSLGTDEFEELFLLQKDIQKAVKTLTTKVG